MKYEAKKPSLIEENLLETISEQAYIIACLKNDYEVMENKYIEIINSDPELADRFKAAMDRLTNPYPEGEDLTLPPSEDMVIPEPQEVTDGE